MKTNDSQREVVVVVGTGNAALIAAISAQEEGATVSIIDAAPEVAMGGNSRFTLGGFRFGFHSPKDVEGLVPSMDGHGKVLVQSHGYAPDDYYSTLQKLSRGEADPVMCRLLADNSLLVLQWMQRQGVQWNLHIWGINPEPMWAASPGNVYASGRGPGLVAALSSRVKALAIDIKYAHRFENVLFDDVGSIRGVVASHEGAELEIPCQGVVMACGGFEANKQMRQTHLGTNWGTMKVRGTKFNTGDGLNALLEIGAQKAGQWSNGHAVPIAADAPDVGSFELGETTRRCLFQYGISVNRSGRRFMDEGADRKWFMYSATGQEVASQEDAIVYQIFDSRIHTANFEKAFYFSGQHHVCATLEQLAEKMGVPAQHFVSEVQRYNNAVMSDELFNPSILDSSMAVGISPPRSHFAARIVKPPFYAFEVTGGITFTYGGVKINQDCQVIDNEDRPIPGLFAAGEMAGGFFAHTYPANAGLMRGAVTGRIAGIAAAIHAVKEVS